MSVYGYARVSTAEQARDGHSLAGQHQAIEDHCSKQDVDLADLFSDRGVSSGRRRPELDRAMGTMAAGDVLIVVRMDRICRSTAEFCAHVDRAQRGRWDLVMLDQTQLDMTQPGGRMMAQMLAVFAEFERGMVRQRTREGLRQAFLEGRYAMVPDDVRDRIGRMADEDGLSMRAIAQTLTDEGIPTPTLRPQWSHATVQRVLSRI